MRRSHPSHLTLSDVLTVSRPFWWVATAAPFALGFFTARGVEVSWPLAIGVLYFAVCYSLWVYGLNQILDHQGVTRQPHTRSIVLAPAKNRVLLAVIVALNVPFWLYFVVMGSSAASIWLVAMICSALAFSGSWFRYKEVPGLDALTAAFIYTAPFIFGVLFGGGNDFWLAALLAFFIWAVASYAFGAIQDTEADREARVDTIATRLGADNTLILCLGCYLAAAALPVIEYGWKGVFPAIVLLWYAVLVLITLPFKRNTSHIIFRKAWRLFTFINYSSGILLIIYFMVLHRLS